jgi:hypothetical protein
VEIPAPPERKAAFEKVEGEAPDSQHAGPVEKPIFIRGAKGWMQRSTGRIAALTALLVAAVALMDAAAAKMSYKKKNGGAGPSAVTATHPTTIRNTYMSPLFFRRPHYCP